MKIDLEQQFWTRSDQWLHRLCKALRTGRRRVGWHVIAPPNAFGDEYWLEGDKLFRAVVDRMENGTVSVRPKTTSLGLPAKHEEAIRSAIKRWSQRY